MGATSWTEGSQTSADWQEGSVGVGAPSDDYFIDFLMEGTTFYDPLTGWTENSQSASSWTERSQTATTFTEREA